MPASSTPRRAVLRVLDFVLAGVLLLALSPLLVLVAALIFVLSHRSPLVAHRRAGLHGKPFWLLKFRTMWQNGAPRESERVWLEYVVSTHIVEVKPRRDPRVTSRFAALCRMYSIDELPQLGNIIRGEMSMVGPRPLTEFELRVHYGKSAGEILALVPGVTGLWQVMGRNNLSYRQRRRLDVFLVKKYSPGFYWWILLRTIPRVLSGSGAW